MKAVKKTWLVDPDLVRKAQKICGAATETETVTRALTEVLIRDEIDLAFHRNRAVIADIEEVFPDSRSR
jgi:hypothetical protein